VDRATLLFVVREGRILLMRKKRGLGAGKINGPGGRIDPGETPVECALRELREELCVTSRSAEIGGELSFQFVDGYSVHVYVFRSDSCEGTPQETAEAAPLWTRVDRIPYEEMWSDDRLWLPLLLRHTPFRGRFLFDGDRLLDHRLEEDYPPKGARG
jgi:8-oxo-dGTP diphosphatase